MNMVVSNTPLEDPLEAASTNRCAPNICYTPSFQASVAAGDPQPEDVEASRLEFGTVDELYVSTECRSLVS